MKVNEKTLDNISQMACLELDPQQRKSIQAELTKMVSWVEKLLEVDTEGVQPLTTLSSEINQLSNDEPEAPLSQKEALVNAPHAYPPYFVVPGVKE
ncbi:MAG: Asp-tRNA(Asn)/Glu-tRNA(Gln) amidotransferase subunit GatC [Bacteroidota bacterium]